MDEKVIRLSAQLVAVDLLRAAAGHLSGTNRWHDSTLSDADNDAIRKTLLQISAALCGLQWGAAADSDEEGGGQ